MVDTPQGSRNKSEFDAKARLLKLSRPMTLARNILAAQLDPAESGLRQRTSRRMGRRL
jgi:hypothetical protein